MTISVITPVINNVAGIERTIISVRDQESVACEHIIVDGGSTDGTLGVIERLSNAQTTLITDSGRGIYPAINQGVEASVGDLIVVLNSGDFFMQNALAHVVDTAAKVKGDIYYCNQISIEEHPRIWRFTRQIPGRPENMKYGMTVFHEATFVRRGVYESIGLYDETFRVIGDMEFFLRAVRCGAEFTYVPVTTTCFFSGGASSGIKRYTEGFRLIRKYMLPTYWATWRKILEYIIKSPYTRYMLNGDRMQVRRIREQKMIIDRFRDDR